jgi:hypothetical protein
MNQVGAGSAAFIIQGALVAAVFVQAAVVLVLVVAPVLRKSPSSWKGADWVEVAIRVFAALTGVILVLGLTVAGFSVTGALIKGTENSGHVTFALGAIAVPLVVGSIVGLYLVKTLKRPAKIRDRVAILVAAIVLSAFIEVYVAAAGRAGVQMSRLYLPCMSFVIGFVPICDPLLHSREQGR